jgi:hypothetical protein
LQYTAWGTKCSIYVYVPFDPPPDGVSPEELRARELWSACDAVLAQQPDATMPWPPRLLEPFALQYFLVEESLSVVGIAVAGDHFVKLRLTYLDDPHLRKLMESSLRDLSDLVAACLVRMSAGRAGPYLM